MFYMFLRHVFNDSTAVPCDALSEKSLFLGISVSDRNPYLCTRKKIGIKATDKRETVIAHIVPAVFI